VPGGRNVPRARPRVPRLPKIQESPGWVACPIGRPASPHACPASKDTYARASVKHHAGASVPQAKCGHSPAIKQRINVFNEYGKASTARRAGGHVHVNPRRRTHGVCLFRSTCPDMPSFSSPPACCPAGSWFESATRDGLDFAVTFASLVCTRSRVSKCK